MFLCFKLSFYVNCVDFHPQIDAIVLWCSGDVAPVSGTYVRVPPPRLAEIVPPITGCGAEPLGKCHTLSVIELKSHLMDTEIITVIIHTPSGEAPPRPATSHVLDAWLIYQCDIKNKQEVDEH